MKNSFTDLVAAGDGVAPYPGRGHPAEPPHGAGPEDVRLLHSPHRDGPLLARRAGRRPQLRAGVRRVIGPAAVPLGPRRRTLQESIQAEALG